MSLPELLYRIKWKTKLETYYKILSLKQQKINLPFEQLQQDFNSTKFWFEYSQEKNKEKILQEYYPNLTPKSTISKANAYLQHTIPIYELRKNLGKEINWNKDYKTEKIWTRQFIGKIHHADSNYGYVRYIWELNRCNHLVTLAQAYFLTENEKYAQEIISQIGSWIGQNPYLKTINWFSGLELGTRIINWTIALKLIKKSSYLTQERLNNALSSIYLQTDFTYHNLSKYSSANNHLVGELASIKLTTAVFPHFPHAKKWNKISTKKIDREILQQIYEDGVGKEQSVNYLLFILDLYFWSSLAIDQEIKPEIKTRIIKSREFLSALEIGTFLPSIGDTDEAYVSGIHSEKERINFFNHWTAKINHNPQIKNTPSKLFPLGGYFISKNTAQNTTLIFDCGPLGYLSTSGHGHCDALSFILTINNKPFFTDPGTYVYHEGKEWRNYFKSTEAHNTIKIDQRDQSQITGPFTYGKKAQTKIINSKINPIIDEITASHNGYKNRGVIHQRTITHDKKAQEITILDILQTKNNKPHELSLFFNLSPTIKIQESSNNHFILSQEKTKIKLTLDPSLNTTQHHGETNPIFGWNSPQFGIKIPSLCLESTTKITTTTTFKTTITY